MNPRTKLIFVSAVLAMGIALTTYYTILLVWDDIKPRAIFSIRFAKTQGLAKKDDVLIHGLKIGRVRALKLEGDHQLIEIEIDPTVRLYRVGVKAEIERTDAFGTVAVFLDPGDPDSGFWPPGQVIEGSYKEAVESAPDDSENPRAISEGIHDFELATEALTQVESGRMGRLLNDPDIPVALRDAIAQLQDGTKGLRETVAHVASNETGGFLTRDEEVSFGAAMAGLRETLAQVNDTLGAAARGEPGFSGRLLGDSEAGAGTRDVLHSVKETLDEYMVGEGAFPVVTHAPEPGDHLVDLMEGLRDTTDGARRGENSLGTLVGPGTGFQMKETLAAFDARVTAQVEGAPGSGVLFSADPAGKAEAKDVVTRFETVLRDMRKALARIRADQAPNTFQGALFSIF